MGKKNFTIADIAAELGVSKTTVSRSISGKGRISKDTRERVLRYIKEHNYKPNVIAKGLANSCTYNIGVVMPENFGISDAAFFVDCLSGIHMAVAAREYDILMTVCDNINMTNLEHMVARQKVDGVILMRTFVDDKAIKLLKKSGIPFVVIGSSSCSDVVQIDQDNEKACKELVSLLLGKSLEQPALIGGSMNQVVNQRRFKGYIAACNEAEIFIQDKFIYTECKNSSDILAAVKNSLQNEIHCIICTDDSICMETLNHLRYLGIDIPKQVKIASFFHSALLDNCIPSITSVSFDVKKLGAVSGNTLIDIIEEKDFSYLTLLGYEINLKESTQ